MPSSRQEAGASGEALAAGWYEAAGFDVVARNWRCRSGELDLVVRRGSLMVFCEVKTRRTDRYGSPAESVTPRQQRRVRAAAAAFLSELPRRSEGAPSARQQQRSVNVRFDVACVQAGEVAVIEAAF